jgi:hypothetical protein
MLVPNLDRLIKIDRILSSSVNHQLIDPINKIKQDNLIGWVIEENNYYLLYSNSVQEIRLTQLPVSTAIVAWHMRWLDNSQLNTVLIANNHLMKPGDQGVMNDNDGHYSIFCWCNWRSDKLYLSSEDANLQLLKHINNH